MTDQELDARLEIAREFLHDYIDRQIQCKWQGPQNSEAWLRAIGFYGDAAIIPDAKHNRWRVAMGMEPKPKEYRYFHNGVLLPLGVRTMNWLQFAEYEKLLPK